jgi:guanine deaminase
MQFKRINPLPHTIEQEPSDTDQTYYRGTALVPKNRGFILLEDATIICQSGKTISISETTDMDIPITHPNCVWIPGLVDAHLHFPQTRITGSASGPLIPWLNSSVFPEEARFSDNEYARQVAKEFCQRMISAGTTTAFIYSSAHPKATDILFEELDTHGLRAYAGMTLMNRNAPPEVLLNTEQARIASIELIKKWNNKDNGRLQYVITPRFAISCTPDLLEMAAELMETYDLWMQTHLSENKDEIRFTRELFPLSASYTHIYNDFGLLSNKSIFAHCIHLTNSEWKLLASQRAIIAHCPDSNFFLGSGGMSLHKQKEYGVDLMMGSDIGAGRSFSIPLTTGRAYDNALLQEYPINSEELLYTACVAPRKRLGIIDEADFSVLPIQQATQKKHIIDALLFRHDQTTVAATYVRGRLLRKHAP